jgi:polyisoprenoid-binding protein YceI
MRDVFMRYRVVAVAAGLWVGLMMQAPASVRAQAPGWRVTAGEVVVVCPLTVGGSFEAKTRSLSGQLTVDPAQPTRLVGQLAVDLATLDSGIGLRNTHMRDNYLEVGKGELYARAVLSDIVLEGEAATVTGATTFTATLLVHGTRKPVGGQVRIARSGSEVRGDASFPVNLPDFGIPEPRYLGVGVKDQVQVKVKFGSAR